MQLWYDLCELLPVDMLQWDFMKNALLAILLMAPLFGLCSTMIVTGRMSFFSDALGHAGFTGIAIGCICGIASPTWVAAVFAVAFSALFSYVRSRSHQAADTIIGVFSSTAVALGIFIATLGGDSFTKYNRYLIGDVLSITPAQLGMLALALIGIAIFWMAFSNKLTLCTIHPQLAASRGISVEWIRGFFTAAIAVIVTLAMSWVGLMIINSLLVLPGAAARNLAKNLRQYHGLSIVFSLFAGIIGLVLSYGLGASAGAAICLVLAGIFAISFLLRRVVR